MAIKKLFGAAREKIEEMMPYLGTLPEEHRALHEMSEKKSLPFDLRFADYTQNNESFSRTHVNRF